jgi:hypothetical protein
LRLCEAAVSTKAELFPGNIWPCLQAYWLSQMGEGVCDPGQEQGAAPHFVMRRRPTPQRRPMSERYKNVTKVAPSQV